MLKGKNKIKMLEERYDYYKEIARKVNILSYKVFKHDNNEFLEQKLYNLVINLCNQVIYGYDYKFSSEDLFFIADYNLNIDNIMKNFKSNIIKMKLSNL